MYCSRFLINDADTLEGSIAYQFGNNYCNIPSVHLAACTCFVSDGN